MSTRLIRMSSWILPVMVLTLGGAITSVAAPPSEIKIDGKFLDWAKLHKYTDPAYDSHDTDGETKNYKPKTVRNPGADLIEFKFTHDAENLYAYFKTTGKFGRTQRGATGPVNTRRRRRRGRGKAPKVRVAGRFYAILTIDVDNNDETGYWLHEGGYYPTSRGYDVNCEVEWYNGEFNAAPYLNHCCLDDAELQEAFLEQSSGKYVKGKDGPYPAGFMRLKPGTYKKYTQWVYHKDDTITFVLDKGPIVHGIVTGAISRDEHEAEICFPMKGFLVDENGKPIVELGKTLDISFSLETSGELGPDGEWSSDTADPIEGYVLEPATEAAAESTAESKAE
ncbi:hypothetical protein [Symmachiella dynata]|uniref:hypothetical protein n=1 Tax=Symmachiella dynata TaxID=2527995 RepID=UPI0030EE99ED